MKQCGDMHGGVNIRQEQRAPTTVFSEAALSQVQARADFSPHEQVALEALNNQQVS